MRGSKAPYVQHQMEILSAPCKARAVVDRCEATIKFGARLSGAVSSGGFKSAPIRVSA
jgi:hypothetical protein